MHTATITPWLTVTTPTHTENDEACLSVNMAPSDLRRDSRERQVTREIAASDI